MRILQFGDIHLERGNLHLSVPPLREIVAIAERERPDLAIFTGDAVTRRGAFFPETAKEFRRACERIAAACPHGLIAIAGNHDITFDGSACFLQGALEGTDDAVSQTGKIRIVSGAPQIIEVCDDLVVLAIPTPDRYRLNTAINGTGETPESVVNAAIRGLMAQAFDLARDRGAGMLGANLVVAYHGALNGAAMDNEQIIRAGIDIPIDPALFHDADLVVLGHMHNPQTVPVAEGGPTMIYQGASCPLTWGERKVEPRVYIHDLMDDGLHHTSGFPLPVVAQMIERAAEIYSHDAEDCRYTAIERVEISAAIDREIPHGSRVRVKLSAPRDFLDVLPTDAGERIATKHDLLECKIVAEATDDRVALAADLERGVSIVEALRFWLTSNEADEHLRDQVLALAQEIEAAVVDEDIDARFDFEPERLWVKNWCQYDEAEVNFDALAGVVMVRGENTAGKSNLLRAVPFIAYGSQRSGDCLQDLIRHGEKSAEAELEFRSRGDRYRIRRVLKRGAGRSASSVVYFDRQAETEWVPAVDGTAAETQAKISSMIGPLDLFLAAAYADQNSIDSLLDLRPAELKDLLATVLHRDFEGRVAMVRARARDAKQARDRAGVVSEEASGEADRLKDVPNVLDATQEARDSVAQRMKDQPNEDDLRRSVDTEREYCAVVEAEVRATGHPEVLEIADGNIDVELVIAQDAHAAAVTELQDLQNDDLQQQRVEMAVTEVARLEEAARGVEATRSRLAEVMAEISRAEAENTRGREAGPKRDQAILAAKTRDMLISRKTDLTVDLGAATTAANHAIADAVELALAAKKAREAVDARERQHAHDRSENAAATARASQVCEQATQAAALLDSVPCRGETWQSVTDDGFSGPAVDMGGCALLARAIKARDELPWQEDYVRDLRATAGRLDAEGEAIAADRARLNEQERELADKSAEANSLRDRQQSVSDDIRRIDAELVQVTREAEQLAHLDEIVAAGLAAAAKLPGLRATADQLAAEIAAAGDEHLDAARRELEAARKDLADRQARRQELDAAALRASRMVAALEARARLSEPRRRLVEATTKYALLVETRGRLAEDLGRLDRELAGLQVKAARLAEVQDKIAATAAELSALDRQLMILATYERALGRDGVPFVLLEQHAIPEIRARVNHYLAPTQYRVEIETERSSVTAGLKPGVYATFTDPRGRHPLSAASGEQRVSIGSALRQAVADLHASATGTVIRLSVQDEGFGAFDATRLRGAFETIRRIAERRKTFVFISHVEGMDSIADHLVEVHAGENGAGSRIVVDGERSIA